MEQLCAQTDPEILEDRIRDKFIVSDNGCWLWTSKTNNKGYSQYSVKNKYVLGHRHIYEILKGSIPAGLVLDHLCRVPACVNPDHLEPVTQKENLLRGNTFAGNVLRTNRCKNGHEYVDGNTYVSPSGGKRCRECSRILDRQPHRLSVYRRKLKKELKNA